MTLSEYRQRQAQKWDNTADQYNETFLWKTGFDCAINLGLAVKFAEWQNGFRDETGSLSGAFGEMSWQELFDYWINNIFPHQLK